MRLMLSILFFIAMQIGVAQSQEAGEVKPDRVSELESRVEQLTMDVARAAQQIEKMRLMQTLLAHEVYPQMPPEPPLPKGVRVMGPDGHMQALYDYWLEILLWDFGYGSSGGVGGGDYGGYDPNCVPRCMSQRCPNADGAFISGNFYHCLKYCTAQCRN